MMGVATNVWVHKGGKTSGKNSAIKFHQLRAAEACKV